MPHKAVFLILIWLLLAGMARLPGGAERYAPPAQLEVTDTAEPEPAETEEPPATETVEVLPVDITGVEPGIIWLETGGPLSIYGSGFTPGIAVRLVAFGLLDAVVLNQNAIRAVVPPGVPEGTYDLDVITPGGAVHSVRRAVVIRSSIPTATPTPTTGRSLAFNQPQMVIQSARTVPEILQPGEPFRLRLELVNRGDVTATNIRVALGASETAVPVGGSSLSVIDVLKSGETAALELSLALSEAAAEGFHTLDLTLTYSDYYRREFSAPQSVGISVSSSLERQPLVLLTAYRTEPESLAPGDTFTLTMNITNVGQSDARQVLLTLGGEGSAGLGPFAILGSGNILHVVLLPPGATTEVRQELVLDGAAEAGVFQLPVTLAYDGPGSERLTETQVLNLIASRRPQIRINYYRSLEIGKVGEPIELPIELINIGRDLVNVSTVTVSDPALEIENGTLFIGPLDGGTSGTVDVIVVPQSSGTHSVQVTVNYLDDFNQNQEITTALPLVVEEEEVVSPVESGGEESGDSPTFWERLGRIIRGLFGLGS